MAVALPPSGLIPAIGPSINCSTASRPTHRFSVKEQLASGLSCSAAARHPVVTGRRQQSGCAAGVLHRVSLLRGRTCLRATLECCIYDQAATPQRHQ